MSRYHNGSKAPLVVGSSSLSKKIVGTHKMGHGSDYYNYITEPVASFSTVSGYSKRQRAGSPDSAASKSKRQKIIVASSIANTKHQTVTNYKNRSIIENHYSNNNNNNHHSKRYPNNSASYVRLEHIQTSNIYNKTHLKEYEQQQQLIVNGKRDNDIVEVPDSDSDVEVSDNCNTSSTSNGYKQTSNLPVRRSTTSSSSSSSSNDSVVHSQKQQKSPNVKGKESSISPKNENGESNQVDPERLLREIEEVTQVFTKCRANEEDKVNLDHFQILRVLGTGAYGQVYLVRKVGGHDDRQLYAMKVLRKDTVSQKKKTAEHTTTERQVLEAIQQSPFLVGMHYAFQTDSKLYIILDYIAGGELFTHLFKAEHFSEATVRIYIAEVVLALEHLHQLGVIYRDIKLENILLDHNGHIVIADFGLSKIFKPDSDHRTHSFCGTLEYMAPEIIRSGANGHDLAVDWWSVGVLTYELLTGSSPFTVSAEQENAQNEISRRIQKAEPMLPSSLSETVKDFILKMLHKDPKKRLGGNNKNATEIKSHPFFKGVDWTELRSKRRRAPFVPTIEQEDDTQNFAEEFTTLEAIDLPAPAPPNAHKLFRGYTYVAPQHMRKRLCNYSIEYNNTPILNPPDKPNNLKLGPVHSYGTFGNCHIVSDCDTDTLYIAKVIPMSKYRASEVDALISCCLDGHESVCEYISVYKNGCDVWILMEFVCGGELVQQMHIGLSEFECCNLFKQICDALRFIHSKNFIHGDIKPENILFSDLETQFIKIVDFGSACYNNQLSWKDSPRYTLDYAPPEALKDTEYAIYSKAFDIWCLGATLYAMYIGHAPFRKGHNDSHLSENTLRERILNEDFYTESEKWQNSSPEFQDLIRSCLIKDLKKRITLFEVLEHSWFNIMIDSLVEVTGEELTEEDEVEREGEGEEEEEEEGLEDVEEGEEEAEEEGVDEEDGMEKAIAERDISNENLSNEELSNDELSDEEQSETELTEEFIPEDRDDESVDEENIAPTQERTKVENDCVKVGSEEPILDRSEIEENMTEKEHTDEFIDESYEEETPAEEAIITTQPIDKKSCDIQQQNRENLSGDVEMTDHELSLVEEISGIILMEDANEEESLEESSELNKTSSINEIEIDKVTDMTEITEIEEENDITLATKEKTNIIQAAETTKGNQLSVYIEGFSNEHSELINVIPQDAVCEDNRDGVNQKFSPLCTEKTTSTSNSVHKSKGVVLNNTVEEYTLGFDNVYNLNLELVNRICLNRHVQLSPPYETPECEGFRKHKNQRVYNKTRRMNTYLSSIQMILKRLKLPRSVYSKRLQRSQSLDELENVNHVRAVFPERPVKQNKKHIKTEPKVIIPTRFQPFRIKPREQRMLNVFE
ncbi:chromosomal serine/threonine-protein kinase JIL-1 [Teleopsis dalmanni]|uniref:chromosomal serine/threonine-protein kinase JIL-1 n=1 Tax=Teleopsis dalmanni TaxID=139649 RepID=UPI0018CD30A4|nr:chromosomal serine/threonine-protein kinase JIL-1 [Teleopsis dalmanni]